MKEIKQRLKKNKVFNYKIVVSIVGYIPQQQRLEIEHAHPVMNIQISIDRVSKYGSYSSEWIVENITNRNLEFFSQVKAQ